MENKRKIDEYIPKAIDALNSVHNNENKKIVENGKINKTFSGQIATFAVAVSTSSLLSAVAFFSDNGSSSVERSLLMDAIYKVIKNDESTDKTKQYPNNAENRKLLEYVKRKYEKYEKSKNRLAYNRVKEDILNAAIAVKLAMNFYELIDDSDKGKQ